MRHHLGIFGLLLAGSVALVLPRAARAQDTAEPRWTAWLGCWAPDPSRSSTDAGVSPNAERSTTCIVPASSSRGVDVLTVVSGAVVTRRHLQLRTSAAEPFTDEGCRGTETVRWSASGRRAYLHADYVCADSARGTSTTLLAFSPTGEWLRVSGVRAEGGSIVTVDHMREVPVPEGVPGAAARDLAQQRRAITTARAAAAAPITLAEVVDALDATDSAVVRIWIIASQQRFAFDAEESALLTRTNLPPSVLQAMLGASSSDREARPASAGESVFASTPVYVVPAYPAAPTTYVCQPYGCYVPAPYPAAYGLGLYPTYGAYPYYGYGYSPYRYPYPRPGIRHPVPLPRMRAAPAGSSRPIVAQPRAPYVYKRRP